MLEVFDDVKNFDEVMRVLEALNKRVLEAVLESSTADDPTEGYHEGIEILEITFEDLPCGMIESSLKGVLFQTLQERVRRMMKDLQEYRKGHQPLENEDDSSGDLGQ